MTHGEAWFARKSEVQNNNSLNTDPLAGTTMLPERMSRSEAISYYRKKLFNHWVGNYSYDERVDEIRKKQIVSTFMLGNPKHYKKYEELRDEL